MAEPGSPDRRATDFDLLSRWAGDLAHEIRNPLNSIVLNLEIVKSRAGGDREPILERAAVVESELHRVHLLIDAFLRLVRPGPPDDAAGPEEVFRGLIPLFQARCRVRKVEYGHQAGEGTAAIPPGELAWILVALVDRAIDETPAGGRVLTTVREGPDAVEVTIERVAPAPEPGLVPDPAPAPAPGPAADADPDADPRIRDARRRVEAAAGSLVAERTGGGDRVVVRLRSRTA